MTDPLAAFVSACRLRDPIRATGTNALRLLDGTGDGAPFRGLIIDDFAGRWLVQTNAADEPPPEWLRGIAPAPASIYWKRLDARDKEAARHWAGERIGAPFVIEENALRYRVDFQAGYSQGIFLDQRDNRLTLRRRTAAGTAVLNCFAYTCAFSVAAAAAGAATVSIDLSRRSLDWGRENFVLNGLGTGEGEGHEFVSGDVFDWLRRFHKQGRRFAGVVLDPPTFSRNREGHVFRVREDFGRLVELAAPLLEPAGWMLCTANQRSLAGGDFRRMIVASLPDAKRWKIDPAPMPADFSGTQYLQTAWLSS
jgi:23S rRNA (cytosine1962-C5)-methyltransferase